MSNVTALVLLSGGRDSMLAAGLAIERGHIILPITFDNGHMRGTERAQFVVDSLLESYGREKVDELVIESTAKKMYEYVKFLWYRKSSVLAQTYPDLQLYQAHCLACKAAMYARAIEICKSFGFRYLVDGARKSQGFFVDLEEMRHRFSELCHKYGVELLTPVYDLESDQERKRMLDDRGLPTKTLEPQCYLGCPLAGKLSSEERESLRKFYDNELVKCVTRDIERS